MLDRLKQALGIAEAPEPPRAPQSTALIPVPVHRVRTDAVEDRPQASMGWLDRHPDSARPVVQGAPALRSADFEHRLAHAPVAAAVRHLLTQSAFLSFGAELNVCWISGPHGLEPSITVPSDRLGWSEPFAKTWAKALERLYAEWADHAESCDTQGRLKWGAMQGAMVRSYLATGDIIAALDYAERPGSLWRTSINVLDPSRLWTPPPAYQGQQFITVRDGIELAPNGRALAYHIRPLTLANGGTIRIPVTSGAGKRLLCHTFDADVGTIRGVSPLGAAVGGILQSMNVGDAAVLAAHVAAMVVGTVTSDLPSDAVARSIGGEDGSPLAAMMASRVSWHEALKKNDAHLRLGNGARIAHLSTGEKFDLFAGKVPFSEYEKIIRLGLAEAARGLGLSPEHLHGLKDQASYSALKVAASEARAVMERRRAALLAPVCEFALWSIAEEAISDGRLPWPTVSQKDRLADFRRRRALIQTEWRGPAIEEPDALKAAKAAIERIRWGLSSHTDEIGALGKDAETVFRNRANDAAMLDELGLELPWPNAPTRKTP
jgi:lambda family phage portal protein